MNWPVFLIASLIAVALDGSLVQVLRVGDASPSLLMFVMVYALLNASKRTALRAAMVAGLFVDLLSPLLTDADGSTVVIVGPHLLAFALGAAAFLSFRNLLYRKSPLALAFGCVIFALLVALGTTTVFLLRSMFTGDAPWGDATATGYLLVGFARAGLTAILAAFLLPTLDRSRALWAFEGSGRLVGGAAR